MLTQEQIAELAEKGRNSGLQLKSLSHQELWSILFTASQALGELQHARAMMEVMGSRDDLEKKLEAIREIVGVTAGPLA